MESEDGMRIEIYKGRDGRWYWRMRARNGRVVADGSQGYARRRGAWHAVRRLVLLIARGCPIDVEVMR